jgi:hypothetical protein
MSGSTFLDAFSGAEHFKRLSLHGSNVGSHFSAPQVPHSLLQSLHSGVDLEPQLLKKHSSWQEHASLHFCKLAHRPFA